MRDRGGGGAAIGTALGWGNAATIAPAVGLASLFGYSLTSLPLLSSGMALRAVVLVALAADWVSIPGAMEAGLGGPLFWGSLTVAFAVAFAITVPANRWLIAPGRGHAVVHGHHGRPGA